MRNDRYKLIYYYGESRRGKGMKDQEWVRTPEWELFDLEKDPYEMNSVYHDPSYAKTLKELKVELKQIKAEVQDKD